MPSNLTETFASCPYCGESISLLIEYSTQRQHYIEDCEVCCRPITVVTNEDEQGNPLVNLYQENEISE